MSLTQNDLQNISQIVENELKPVKKDISSIKKDIKTIVNVFDHEYLSLRKRVDRVETHLGLPPYPQN